MTLFHKWRTGTPEANTKVTQLRHILENEFSTYSTNITAHEPPSKYLAWSPQKTSTKKLHSQKKCFPQYHVLTADFFSFLSNLPFSRTVAHGSKVDTQGGTNGTNKGTETCSWSHLALKFMLDLCFNFLFIFKNNTESRKQSSEHFHVIKEGGRCGLHRAKLCLVQWNVHQRLCVSESWSNSSEIPSRHFANKKKRILFVEIGFKCPIKDLWLRIKYK